MFLIALERKRGAGSGLSLIMFSCETLCDRICKADSHALVINAKLNLARPG